MREQTVSNNSMLSAIPNKNTLNKIIEILNDVTISDWPGLQGVTATIMKAYNFLRLQWQAYNGIP